MPRSSLLGRRDLLWLAAPFARAAETASIRYREYARCGPDYLSSLVAAALPMRDSALAKLTTADAIGARQSWVRDTFWKLTGGQPERTPLNLRTTGSFTRTGYKVEKLLYESQPGLVIPANLYIPTSARPPFPGVLFQMGHSLNGKAAVPYQKCCQGLARLGYLVLAFDPMGQGERTYYPKPGGTLTRLPSADDEHTIPGRQMLLIGDTATRLQTWDAVRSLDVLAAHPLVDPKRLASTGQSGGGTLTMWLTAVDDRLAAAAPSCPNTENFVCPDFSPPGSTDDAEQNFVAAAPLGFDRWDTLYPFAPKPLLIAVSARDFFGTYSPRYLDSGRREFTRLRAVYETLGHAGKIAWRETPLPHGLSYGLRLEIYNWFERWLKDSSKPIAAEPAVAPEADEVLWATQKGLTRLEGSKTPQQIAAARPRITAAGDFRTALGRLDINPNSQLSVLGAIPHAGATAHSFECATAPNVWVPGYLFLPETKPRHTLLLLHERGRNAAWQEEQLYPELSRAGLAVAAIDVRAHGDLRSELPRGAPGHATGHANEEAYAWASLMLGQPLLNQRVTDILTVVSAVRRHAPLAGMPLVLAAHGTMTVPALFAAALSPEIDRLYLANALISFRSVLEQEDYSYPFAHFLPGLLNTTDLPAIAAAIAPRKVRIVGLLDGADKPVPGAAAQALYSAPHIQLSTPAAWDVKPLLEA